MSAWFAHWDWGILGWLAAATLLLALLYILADFYRYWRDFYRYSREKRFLRNIGVSAALLDDIAAGLRHENIHDRLGTLVTVQRLSKGGGHAAPLAALLTGFVRNRLAVQGADRDAREDVRFALSIILSNAVRTQASREHFPIDLSGLDFRGLSLRGFGFAGLNLTGAIFDGCDLHGANFQVANLSGASLRGVDLSSARLIRATLAGADMENADLTKARLDLADLSDADISGALLAEVASGLTQKQLDSAFGDSATSVPERFRFIPSTTRQPKPALAASRDASST